MLIVGITGTNGSGKGTVADYLIKHHHFKHYSARDFIVEEMKRRGMEVNRDNMLVVANGFRQEQGSDFIIRSLFERARTTGAPAIIESVRSRGECEFIHQQGGKILAIDAPVALRYERIKSRAGVTDKVSLEQFIQSEHNETSSSDPCDSNLLVCIDLADEKLDNSRGMNELYQQIGAVVERWIRS